MSPDFNERRKRRLESYGASITKNGKTRVIKAFRETGEHNLNMLERLRKIFYPELKDNPRLDKTFIRKK